MPRTAWYQLPGTARKKKLDFATPSPRKRKSSTWSAPDAKDDGEDVDGDDDDDDDDEDVEDDNDSDNSHKVFAQLNGRSDGGSDG